MIKLKEGQKVLDEDGNEYLIEKNDVLIEKHKYNSNFTGYVFKDLDARTSKALKKILNDEFINYDYFNDHGYGLYITDIDNIHYVEDILKDLKQITGYNINSDDLEMNL